METKIFYRVANNNTEQGLWYDFNGKFTGLIHNEFDFCSNNKLPMPYNPNIIGWLSTVDTLDDLFFWFTKKDIKKLELHGFGIAVYEATDYKKHENHWIIKQDNSKFIGNIPIDTV